MTNIHGNDQPVRFAFQEATALAKACRNAADSLDQFANGRPGLTDAALQQWRGRFADTFRGDVPTGTNNARDIAGKLRGAATLLESLAADARDEQNRRRTAQAWYYRHANKDLIDQIHDGLFGESRPPQPASNGPSRVATAAGQPTRSL